ncbi:hypothetical protein [Mammaliicoccus sciuri]|uniref:hypothetical protein n=1 Tax=Mammaliicoccus sciuri TaxID=1296 RepID=UPI003F567AF0
MIRRTKKVTVQELYDIGIASKQGIIDYRKYSAFKLRYRMKGYDVRLKKSKVFR